MTTPSAPGDDRGRATDAYRSERHERDYLERTIATVRNHRGADNCWPQWANIFADEIERLWKVENEIRARLDAVIVSHGAGEMSELLAELLAPSTGGASVGR